MFFPVNFMLSHCGLHYQVNFRVVFAHLQVYRSLRRHERNYFLSIQISEEEAAACPPSPALARAEGATLEGEEGCRLGSQTGKQKKHAIRPNIFFFIFFHFF